IGGGWFSHGGNVTITGGSVKATAGIDWEDGRKAGQGIGRGYGGEKSGTLKIGEGMELYGGENAGSAVRLSGPTESYTGSRPVYMEVRPTT
ncbi:MAG: hypothetical protein IKR01_05450, partial [Spirochaetales bacterium]|nr:hypothetical protein [Spirochaetales bacterium]